MRRDIFIDGASTLFAVSARDLGGRERGPLSMDLAGSGSAGLVVPLQLAEAVPFIVRVVEGPLNETEASEWVGHVTASIACADGMLRLESGFEAWPDVASLVDLRVATGNLQLDLYTYLGGSPNGDHCYEKVADGVPLGRWFRQTRPGEEFPDWLALRCLEEPNMDPGFEGDWAALAQSRSLAHTRSRLHGRPFLAFVLQVRPGLVPVAPAPRDVHGLIPIDVGARLPDYCPRGLDARVALSQPTDQTDLPMQTELPDAVLHPAGTVGRGFWDRVRGWVGGQD